MKLFITMILALIYIQIYAQNNRLTIHVTDLENRTGQLIIDLFSTENGYPMKTEKAKLRKKIVLPKDGKVVVYIDNLANGEYAFAIIHDENMNNKIDVNFIGIPKEGAGASNNAKGFMSPPSYNAAKFDFKKSSEVTVKMSYF